VSGPNPAGPGRAAAPEADRALNLGRALARLGRIDRALEQYDVALAHRPWDGGLVDEALDVIAATGDWARLARWAAAWIVAFPDHATHHHADVVHHRHVDALCRAGGLDAALSAYGLEPVGDPDVVIGPDEIVALVGLRNEAERLEWFLEHHRRLGVDRFLVVDNDSDDGSLALLADRPDVVCWRTAGSYRAANCGAVWWDLLTRRHLQQQWSLIVDADECFVFPGSEQRTLGALCAELDRRGATAYRAMTVDCYGAGPQSTLAVEPGRDPLEVFPYFDAAWYRTRMPFTGPRRNLTNYSGGVRARVFGGPPASFLLDKVPLRRARPGETWWSGNHWVDRPTAELAGRGALLHTKFGASFAAIVAREAGRGEHPGGARVYRHLATSLAADPDPDLYDPLHSVRYGGTGQLVALGIARTLTDEAGRVPVDVEALFRPPIPPVPAAIGGAVAAGADRPEWSVVVVAAQSGTSARVEAVLAALDRLPPSEVVVVVGPAERVEPAPPGGTHRVRIVHTAAHLTALAAANLGLAATEGRWVHVVGPEETVRPDTYHQLTEARAADPAATVVVAGIAPAEVAPAGVAADLAMSAGQLAVRRDRLEAIGGFCPAVEAAGPWELLQRALGPAGRPAVVAGDLTRPAEPPPAPPPLAGYGTPVVQWLAAVDVAVAHRALDGATRQALVDRVAVAAAASIVADVEAGRVGSALATAAEILIAPLSPAAHRAVVAALGTTRA